MGPEPKLRASCGWDSKDQLLAQQAALTSTAQVWVVILRLALPVPSVAIVVEQAVQLCRPSFVTA